jgi:hypothetical protein
MLDSCRQSCQVVSRRGENGVIVFDDHLPKTDGSRVSKPVIRPRDSACWIEREAGEGLGRWR